MECCKVKICGLKRREDIELVNRLCPDFVGFVFAGTKRKITAAQAAELRKQLDSAIRPVGVFVNEPEENVAKLAEDGIIDLIQLHGDETEEYIRRLRELTKAPIIRAVRVRDEGPGAVDPPKDAAVRAVRVQDEEPSAVGSSEDAAVRTIYVQDKGRDGSAAAPAEGGEALNDSASAISNGGRKPSGAETQILAAASLPVDYLLLDTYRAGEYGGSGECFGWEAIGQAAERLAAAGGRMPPYFLAGGLSPENAVAAAQAGGTLAPPFALDVSSGVETDSFKDEAKVRAFLAAVRGQKNIWRLP